MDDAGATAWEADEAPLPADARANELIARLGLVDRIVALEARLAEYDAAANNPTTTLTAEQRLLALQSSLAWRLGSLLTNPGRIVRRLTARR